MRISIHFEKVMCTNYTSCKQAVVRVIFGVAPDEMHVLQWIHEPLSLSHVAKANVWRDLRYDLQYPAYSALFCLSGTERAR